MKAYKFRSWDKKYHKELLTKKEIYFPSTIKFNDPFDCKIPLRYDLVSDEYLRKYFRGLMSKMNNLFIEPKLTEIIESTIKKVKNPIAHQKLIVEKGLLIENKYGIFSLTKDYKHTLLWSHYANSHKGFCVEFELEKLENYFLNLFIKDSVMVELLFVEYFADMPIITPSNIHNEEAFELKYKSKVWDYEDEIRLVLNGKTNCGIIYPEECITKIILGCEMQQKHIDEICNALSKFTLKPIVVQAKRDLYSFDLSFE